MQISPDKFRFKTTSNLWGKFTLLKFESIDPNSDQAEMDIVVYESSIKYIKVDTMKDKTRFLKIYFENDEIIIPFVFDQRDALNQLLRLLTTW